MLSNHSPNWTPSRRWIGFVGCYVRFVGHESRYSAIGLLGGCPSSASNNTGAILGLEMDAYSAIAGSSRIHFGGSE